MTIRALLLVLSGVLVLGSAGCGGSGSGKSSEMTPEAKAEYEKMQNAGRYGPGGAPEQSGGAGGAHGGGHKGR